MQPRSRPRYGFVRTLVAAALVVLGVVGCDGDDGGGEGSGADAATVTMVDFAFEPSVLTVPAGTEVVFSNADSVPHTATADDGSFDVQLSGSNELSTTFDEAGSFPYTCSIHPAMTAQIVVE